MSNSAPRLLWGAGAAVCALLLGYGYFLQYVEGLQPCPLCLIQRGFFYAVMALFIAAAAQRPGRGAAIAYGGLIALLAAGGLATAARQVWLQHLPADRVPQCGPDLYFMLENFPLAQTLKKLIAGSGECAKVDWTLLGFSIAEWSLACFIGLALYAVWMGFAPRAKNRYKPS